ncbi:MAG: polyprenyl diphosphate synthase [bacterium]
MESAKMELALKSNQRARKGRWRLRKTVSSVADRGLRATTELPFVQKIYENMLLNQIKEGPIPGHIGVILDGNRRWAQEKGLDPWKGHEQGARKIEDFLNWCSDMEEIRSVTLYTFSTENFKRSEREVAEIFRLLKEYLTSLMKDERVHKNEIRIKMLGRIHLLPQELQDLIGQLEEKTRHYKKHFFNFAIAYGGRTEIVDAVRRLAEDVKKDKLSLEGISENIIENYLYTAHLPNCSPDLIIRTSGEIRLSNFLTWQGAYSELCFLDVFWPAFRKLDFLRALRTYQKRQRRFGG